MFHDIPPAVLERMAYMEAVDARDRVDGTPHLQRMRQVEPISGRFLAWLLACAPAGRVLEIGTSAGYSSLWLSLACRLRGDTLTTFEILPSKVQLARETYRLTGLEEVIELVEGDARDHLADIHAVAFCFLDAEKDIYQACYALVVPNLVPGGLLVADNATSHPQLGPFLAYAQNDLRVDALVVTVGKGLLVARKL
jgi:predicted O-methyltransferase YrrM